MKKTFAMVAAFVTAVALVGCGVKDTGSTTGGSTTSETATATSQDEKTLNIYTALEDEQVSEFLESFRKEHPDVTINVNRESTGIITSKLIAEKDNPQADVIWGLSATSLLVLDQDNLLKPYSPKGVERVNDKFKDTTSATPKWVGNDAWETAILVNKDVLESHGVKDVPESYQDLLKDEYKGLIAMSDPQSSGTGLLTVNGILTLYGEEKGWDYLKDLDKNVAVYLHSGSAPAKQTATGEYGIGVSFGYRCIKSAKDLGDKGVVVFPKEGSGYDIEANALIDKKGNEKEIAKEFLDWAISDEAMAQYGRYYPLISVGSGNALPEGYSKNPIDQLINIDFSWAAKNRESILKQWGDLFSAKSAKN